MKRTALNIVLIFVALFLGASLTRNIFSYKSKVAFYTELKSEHDEAKSRNKKLKSDVSKSSDYYYIERQIRDKLNLLQEGEVSIIIPKITPEPTPAPVVELKPYQQWVALVMKK